MKKKLLSLLLVVLMLLPISACDTTAQESESARKEDSAQANESTENDVPVVLVDSKYYDRILQYAQYLYEGYPVQLQVLPQNYDEREAEFSSLRAEIMAGGGPDAFILTCDIGVSLNDGGEKTDLFANPEKAIRSRIFLPLDELIIESEYLIMEDHHEVIMNAGKTEEGQMVLPLSFSLNVYFIEKASMENPGIELNTWDDMLNCTDEQILDFLDSKSFLWFGKQYTQFVDYENESLLVTPGQIERDLSFFFMNRLDDSAPLTETSSAFDSGLQTWARDPENIRILSVPNDAGGLTAAINAFTAINRNTEHAEEVFKFIELLYSEEVQNDNGVYLGVDTEGKNGRWYGNRCRPSGLLTGGRGDIVTHKNAYPDVQSELVAELIAKVNSVRFESELDGKIAEAELEASRDDIDKAALQTIAEETCAELEMILAE